MIMRIFYIVISLVFTLTSLLMIIMDGASFSAIGGFIFFTALLIAFINQKEEVQLTALAEIQKDQHATYVYDEFEVDDEVVSYSFFSIITSIPKGDHWDHRTIYDVASSNIPLDILDKFFAERQVRKFPKVYTLNGNGYGFVIDHMVAYDDLMVRYNDEGFVISMFWANKRDAQTVRNALKDFPEDYPIIWVHWYPCTIYSLNSERKIGLAKWEFEE